MYTHHITSLPAHRLCPCCHFKFKFQLVFQFPSQTDCYLNSHQVLSLSFSPPSNSLELQLPYVNEMVGTATSCDVVHLSDLLSPALSSSFFPFP